MMLVKAHENHEAGRPPSPELMAAIGTLSAEMAKAASWSNRAGCASSWPLRAIGRIESSLRAPDEAPRQGSEGAPDAWLDIDPFVAPGLNGISAGDELVIVTWLHLADGGVLEVHPRGDPGNPLAGVFATRSPHWPNPLGLHRVTVREVHGTRLRIGPMEAIDGTPVVDIKVWLDG